MQHEVNMNDERDELDSLQAEVAANPGDLEAVFALAQLHVEEDRWDDAIAVYQNAIAAAPDNAALHNDLAVLYDDAGDPQAAEASYRRALAIDPAYGPAYVNLGTLLVEADRIEEATAILEQGAAQAADEADREEAQYYLDDLAGGGGEAEEGEDFNWVAVTVVSGITVAEVIANRLRASGIPAHALQEGAGQALGLTVGPMGDASVLVPEDREEEARLLLTDESFAKVSEEDLLDGDPYITCPHCFTLLELTEDEWEEDSVICPVCDQSISLIEFE
jgi:tetratricopeptide (TPR) repeat protein